jgi:gliding motility-associated-like protein
VDVIYLVQTDANGCVDTAKGQVLVHNLPVANFNNGPGCTNVANPYTSSSTPGDGPIVSYNWNFNGNPLGIDSSFVTMQYSTAGTEQVCLSVQDVYGCVGDTCQTITIYSVPPDTVSPLDTTICAGYSASFRVTNLPTPGGSVQWVPATWVSDATDTDVTITPLQTIQYQVYSYFLQCVPKVDTVTIYVIDSVPVSATCDPQNIVLGLSSTITPTIKGTIDSIIWSPDSTLTCSHCMNPIATPHQTTTYTATIFYHKDNVTCTNTATVTVTVFTSCNGSLIYVPNTFTPNNDGVDDVFKLYGQGINVVTYFRVYDRWGKKVFEADNANNVDNAAWNGGLNNDELNKPENSGVFVYEFEIQCVTGQSVTGKGSVTLIK